ncbi:MAG: hypothetical protein EA401_14390 [Planctomycetota bacterium]|nr:MAG: hypothetical protein EA401_14390 [Planctomycetota bacterium]
MVLELDAGGALIAARQAARLALSAHGEDAHLHLIHAWLHDEVALLQPAIASYLAVMHLLSDSEAAETLGDMKAIRQGEALELPTQAGDLRQLALGRLRAIRPWLDADQGHDLDVDLEDLGVFDADSVHALDPRQEGRASTIENQIMATLALVEARQQEGASVIAQHLLIRALNQALRLPGVVGDRMLMRVAQQARLLQLVEPVLELLQAEAADEPLRTWLALRLALLAEHETAAAPLLADLFIRSPRPPYAAMDSLLALQQQHDATLRLVIAHLAETPNLALHLRSMLLSAMNEEKSDVVRMLLTHLGMIDRELAELPTAPFINGQPLLLILAMDIKHRPRMRNAIFALVTDARDFAGGLWRALVDKDSAALEGYLKAHLPALHHAPSAVQDLLAQLLYQHDFFSDALVTQWWRSRGILAQRIAALGKEESQTFPASNYAHLLLSVALYDPQSLSQLFALRGRVSDRDQLPVILSFRQRSPERLMAYLRLHRHPEFIDSRELTPSQLRRILSSQFTDGRDLSALARWHQQATAATIVDLAAVEFAPLLVSMSEMLRRDRQLLAWAAELSDDDPWSTAWRSAQGLVEGDPEATAIAQEALRSDDSSLVWRLASAQALMHALPADPAVHQLLLGLWSAAISQGIDVDSRLAAHLVTQVASNPDRYRPALQALVQGEQIQHWPSTAWPQVLAVVTALGDQVLAKTVLRQPAAAHLAQDLGTYVTLLENGWAVLAAELFHKQWQHLEPRNLQRETLLPQDAFVAAIADPDLRLLAAALLMGGRHGSPERRDRIGELAQAWAQRRASDDGAVDSLLRERFVDSCLTESSESIDLALAPCLRALVRDDKLVDELNNTRHIPPRRLALLRHELRLGSVAQMDAILAALRDSEGSARRWQLSQVHSLLLRESERHQWPAEQLTGLRRVTIEILEIQGPQPTSVRLLENLLIRHAAAGALPAFTAWFAEHRRSLAVIPPSGNSSLVHYLSQHRPSETAAVASYRAALLELLAEPGLAALVAPIPNLYVQMMRAQLLDEAQLIAEGERLAHALPRAGWAWHELARLRTARTDHDGARQAWQQAIAATTDNQLRERWMSEMERGVIEDAAGLGKLLSRLSGELRAEFAIEKDGTPGSAPSLLVPDLEMLRHRFGQDDVRLAQRRAAGELATVLRHELVGGQVQEMHGLLRLIRQQQAGDTVLFLLNQEDPQGRLIHARAYELLQPAERAVLMYRQLASDHPELPMIQRRLRTAALRAGDQQFLPELIVESDEELSAISHLAARTGSLQGIGNHHELMAQTRMWSAILAARPVADDRPAAWAEAAVEKFMRGTSVSQSARVYQDDIHPSQREGVEGVRRVHQALFAALQPYPAWSEQAFARQVAAAGSQARREDARWRSAALAALVSRAQLGVDQEAAPVPEFAVNEEAVVILPSPLSYLVRLTAADDPQLNELSATLSPILPQEPSAIQTELAAYRHLLSARDNDFLRAAEALLAGANVESWRVPAILDNILHFAAERCAPLLVQNWICAQLSSGTLLSGQDMLVIERWAGQLAEQPEAASAFFAAVEVALPIQRRHAYARLLTSLCDRPALLPAIVARLPEMGASEALVRHLEMRIANLLQRSAEEGMALLAGLGLLADADAAVPAMGRDSPLVAQAAQVLIRLSDDRQAGYRALLAHQEGFLAGVWRLLFNADQEQAQHWWRHYSEHLPMLQRSSRQVQVALAGLLPPAPTPLLPDYTAVQTWAMALGDGHRQRLLSQISAGEGRAHAWGQQLREQLISIHDPRTAQEFLDAALAAADPRQQGAMVRSLIDRWRFTHRDGYAGLGSALGLLRDPRWSSHLSVNMENALFWAIVQAYRDFSGSRVDRLSMIDELLAPQVNYLESVEALMYPLQFVLGRDDKALDWAHARSPDTTLGSAWRLAAGLVKHDPASLKRVEERLADNTLSPYWRLLVARGVHSSQAENLSLVSRKQLMRIFAECSAHGSSIQPHSQPIIFALFPPVAEAVEEWRALCDIIAPLLSRSGRSWSDQVDILAAVAIAINHDDLLQALITQAESGFGQRCEHYVVLLRNGLGNHAAQLWLRRWPQQPTDQDGVFDAELAAALPAFLAQLPEEGVQRAVASLIFSSLPGSLEGADTSARQAAILAGMDLASLDVDQREPLLQAAIGRLPRVLEEQLLGVLQAHLGQQTLLQAIELGGPSGNHLRAWHYARLRGQLASGDSSGLQQILPAFINPAEGASRRLLEQRSALAGQLVPVLTDPAVWSEARLPELRDLVGDLLQVPPHRNYPSPPLLSILTRQHRSPAALRDMAQWLGSLNQELRDQHAGSLSGEALLAALKQALTSVDERLPLIDHLLSDPAVAQLLSGEEGLFPALLEAGLLSGDQLRSQGQSWATIGPRQGWAWAELAQLHHAANEHAAAVAAWDQANDIAPRRLSRRFANDRDRQRAAVSVPEDGRSPQTSTPRGSSSKEGDYGANEF